MHLSPPPPPPSGNGDDPLRIRATEPARRPRSGPGSGASVWLIRHGRVGEPTVAYGDRDVPLSAEGRAQTEAVAAGFASVALRHVVASPLSRARAMGDAIASVAGVPLRLDARLTELHRGDWQDLPRDDYQRRWAAEASSYWADTLHWQGHGGESEHDLVERTWPALVDAALAAEGGIAVVAAHRQVIRALVAAALGLPPAASHGLRLDPASGILLQDAPGGWALSRTNVARPGAPHAAEPLDGPPLDVPMRPQPGPRRGARS